MNVGSRVRYTSGLVGKCRPEDRDAARKERGTVKRVLFGGRAVIVAWDGREEASCLTEHLEDLETDPS